MAAVVPPPPPPPPVISPAPPSDDDDDDDNSSSESSYSESDSDATPIPSSIPVPPPPPPAPVSEPVASVDVAVDDAPAPAKDDRKLWERPWSLKELKNATECWTLAADAGLLLFMKEFSQKVVSKTHEIEKQVDSLIHEAKNTDTRAGNIFNDFMMLSNIQFVENRVYEENEDDDEERQKEEEGEKAQSEERPAEEKQMEVVSRIRDAVSCGLKVLDEAFTKLEVQDEASSDEDEEETLPGYHEPILEAKDPYALRPMPYLIGTAGFFESEDVGIGEFGSEGEEEEEDEEEYSTDEEEEEPQARQQTRGLYEDDSSEELFEPSDKESEEDEKRGGIAEPSSGDSSSSDEDSSSAGEFSSEDDEGGPKKPAMGAPVQMDLQAELAARLGVTPAAPVTMTTGEGSEFESSIAPSESFSAAPGEKHGKKKKKKKKKHKDKGLSEDDNIKSASRSKDAGPFMPDEDEDEGTPFGQDNIFGTSTTAKGLFDESDEEKESSGAFAAGISGKKSTEGLSEDADNESLHSSMSKTSKKKLPAGAVPLFGSSGLFTPDEEKSVTFDDTSTVKSDGSPLITKKKSASSLFDNEDDDDEGGLFSTKKKPSSGSKASPTTAPKPRRHKSSTSSDMFDDKENSGLFFSGQPQEGTAGSPARKKKPVGGVSIFGPQSSLFTDSMKASKSSFDEDDSEAAGLTAEDSSVVSQPVITSTVKTAPTTTTSSSGGIGLFDDSGGEEDLFAAISTQKSKPKGKPPVGGVSIFGGITDELMDGTTSTAPESSNITAAPAIAPTKPVTSIVTSKKSGGLFSDGTESDEDGLFSTKPTTTAAPKITSTEAAKPTSSASKDPFGLSIDDEDSLFSSAPTVSKPPPSVQPVKAEEPKAVSKPKSKGSRDIFSLSDDDDNLFASALTSKPKSAEKKHSAKTEQKTSTSSTSSVKKKPVARLGGLFDNDEDDELFGSSNYGFGLGSSKPSTTKTSEPVKSSKPGLDLLSDNQSEDDGLFTTKPLSTAKQPKEPVPPPTAPKTKQTTAADDLFAAPTDSGNVGGEPSQGSPDVATEPAKPQKKKPAGAVPMFGGVDLFGGGGGGAGIKNTVPATTSAPSVEEKQENITITAPAETKKSFGGLFGSPTSEDDEIFLSKPKKAPVKTPPVTQPQPEQEDDLFGPVKPTKFKTPVSQPQPEQEDDLFGPVKPSKLKSSVSFEAPTMKSPRTKAPAMEKSVSFEEPQKVDTLTNLTKNRAVRQGGRRPPSRQALKTRSSQSDDALAGFTTDIPTSSTQKTSSKQFDAEPLGFGGAGSKPDGGDDLFAASSTVLAPAGGSRSTTRKAKKPVARPTATKGPTDITKDILFGNDDLLAESPPKVTATIVDQKRVTEIEKEIEKEIQEDDDLFSTKVLSKKVTSTIDDELFGIPTAKSTVPSVTTKSVPTAVKVDDDDDELFPSDNKKKAVLLSAATAAVVTAAVTAAVTTSVLNKDDTDAPPPPQKLEGENDDELFPSDDKKKAKKVVKKKKPTVTDEDLFGNTDDIFGNVSKDSSKPATGKSTKAKTGKGKKKKKASSAKATAAEVTATTTTEPVTDVHDGETPAAKPQPSTTETSAPTKDNDFEDSLFGDTADNVKKAKAMKKKAKKKSEPKDYSIFDTDAPSIFDDPLNADK